MATQYGSIDELLTTGKTRLHPETSENKSEVSHEPMESEVPNESMENEIQNSYEEKKDNEVVNENFDNNDDSSDDDQETVKKEYDDYGNEKPKTKIYTEDEVNERINKAVRERLSRMERKNDTQNNSQQFQQQAAKGFEYNEQEEGTWEQQLEAFVDNAISKRSERDKAKEEMSRQREAHHREQIAHAEFEDKFSQGMERFPDFVDIVGNQSLTDAMVYSLRGIKDPAAFLYAASKRTPQDLQRISNIKDPVSQMVEMGRLEERMRKGSSSTNAPRPIPRTKEDSHIETKKQNKKEESIEDLIARSEKQKRAQLASRRGR